jgi:ABC-type transport system substrate-binding protein
MVVLLALLAETATPGRRIVQGGMEIDVAHSGSDYTSLDPALANSNDNWQVLYSTCLKLVNWPDASWPAGANLVPDGAVAMPVVSDHGKTYTFTIKTGQRFSSGAPVTAANFKAAFDRDADPALGSGGATWVDDIVGVDAELHNKATAVSGVIAAGMTLTIRLKRADPTLLERLAMPYFCAIPTNLPRDPHGVDAPPSAGPYYIASRTPGQSVVLEKNPYYTGARPVRADRIVITTGSTQATAYLQVRAGQFALDVSGTPSNELASLAKEFGVNKKRFFVEPTLSNLYLALNTSRPALRNVNLRKAINYALDRPALVRLLGFRGGTPTAHFLPSALTGGADRNAYPIGGPDIAKAKSLLPGGKCGRLVLWSPNDSLSVNFSQEVQSQLAMIGCKVVIETFSPDVVYPAVATRGAAFDIFPASWFADYPDPYDVLYHNLDGNTISARNNFNDSYIDNAALNASIEQANLLPLGRHRLQNFASIDFRAMRDLAPVAPLGDLHLAVFVGPHIGGFTYSMFGAIGADLGTLYRR